MITSGSSNKFSIAVTCIAFLVFIFYEVLKNIIIVHSPFPFHLSLEKLQERAKVTSTCSVGFQNILTVTDVHDFSTALKMIDDAGGNQPVLFKSFIKDSINEWRKIENIHNDVKLSFSELEIKGRGSIWLSGVKPLKSSHDRSGINISSASDIKLKDFFALPSVTATQTIYYASFISFLQRHSVRDNRNQSLEELLNIKADTNFVSNFPQDILATPIHASALGNSYSIQYVGKKLWVFLSPNEMEQFSPVCSPSTLLLEGSEAQYLSSKVSSQYLFILISSFLFVLFRVPF
jgi:hypothetical protein